jgi:hypothetical protein
MKAPVCCKKFMELKAASQIVTACYHCFFQCKKCGKVKLVSGDGL